jgi:hypothetical protein
MGAQTSNDNRVEDSAQSRNGLQEEGSVAEQRDVRDERSEMLINEREECKKKFCI